jgi:hypothetical protein
MCFGLLRCCRLMNIMKVGAFHYTWRMFYYGSIIQHLASLSIFGYNLYRKPIKCPSVQSIVEFYR